MCDVPEHSWQGLPQARPREQQHSALSHAPGTLASHCPARTRVQHAPTTASIQNRPEQNSIASNKAPYITEKDPTMASSWLKAATTALS